MTPEPTAPAGGLGLPPVSDNLDPIAALLRLRVLDPPPHPGALAGLGRFEITGLIGVGGMGVVLLGRDPTAARNVAIKVLKPELVQKAEAVHRFLVEARHMQRLSHPNILEVLEVSDRPEGPYFVMPFMERKSLAGVIRPGEAAAYDLTLRIAREIAGALQYAHGRGLVHRDLKPSNILLDAAGKAYLCDFGLARTTFNDSMVDVRRAHCEGTAPYMPPEVAAGEAGDTRCDIYSFGALLYEMLTGHPPYEGGTASEVLRRIMAEQPQPIPELNPNAPKGLTRIVQAAMARNLRDRYASMADVLADLTRAENGQEPLGPHGRPHRRIGVKQTAVIMAGVLSIGVVAAMSWKLWHADRESWRTGPPFPAGGQVTVQQPMSVLPIVADFRSEAPDESLWSWDQSSYASYPDAPGTPSFSVKQAAGALAIKVGATHERGWTCEQTAWADLRPDLKLEGDVRVTVEIEAPHLLGGIAVMLSEGQRPTGPGDAASIRLYEAGGRQQSLERTTIRFELSRSVGLAAVTRDDAPGERHRIDISRLSYWHVRFYAYTASSTGRPPGDVELRILSLHVDRFKPDTAVVGKVVNDLSSRPIQGATVGTIDGRYFCQTSADGMYCLSVPSGEHRLRVDASDYESSPLKVEIGADRQVRADVRLRKAKLSFGDVVWSVSFDKWHEAIGSFCVNNDTILYTANRAGRAYLMTIEPAGSKVQEMVELFEPAGITGREALTFTGMACFKDAIFGIDWWPGRLYRIDRKLGAVRVAKLPLDWPCGVAFDGAHLWFLECDGTYGRHRYGLHSMPFDPEHPEAVTTTVSSFVPCSDDQICGLAWGNGHLWASSDSGVVYEIDASRALAAGNLESGVLRRFDGHYSRLDFDRGYLWGLDNQAHTICKIYVGSPDNSADK